MYSLLGLRKKTIGKMMFYENLLMGAGAVIAGVLLGTLLSKMFTMLLLRLLGTDVDVGFTLSLEAIGNTIFVFTCIILITSIQGYRLIYNFNLIELFQADKEGEAVPEVSMIGVIIGTILLVFGYWIAFQPVDSTGQILRNLLLIMGSIVTGTYLLFRTAIVYLLKKAKEHKSSYYNGINIIGTSHLLYRIKGNARMLTMIALLSALTLSAITIGISQYYNFTTHAKQLEPFSYTHISKGDIEEEKIKEIIYEDKNHPVQAEMTVPLLKVHSDPSDTDLPEYLEQLMAEFPEEDFINLISAKTFNQVSAALDRNEKVTLSGNEAAMIKPRYTHDSFSDYEGRTITLKLPEDGKQVRFTHLLEGRVLSWRYPDAYIVLSDELYSEMENQIQPVAYKTYQVEDQKNTELTSNQLNQLGFNELQLSTFYKVYKRGLESAGQNIFTLGFLGLVFLAATGCMIYFKQLTEAHSDKGRYEILRKIGVRKKEVLTTISKQSLFIFLLPLIVGISHNLMIVKVLLGINLIGGDISFPILSSIGFYIAIYLGYYIMTVNTYYKIVNL